MVRRLLLLLLPVHKASFRVEVQSVDSQRDGFRYKRQPMLMLAAADGMLTDSKVPCTPSAVAEFSLYVVRIPKPTPTPSGVVTANSIAMSTYVSLQSQWVAQ
jgi:hypothetical protein